MDELEPKKLALIRILQIFEQHSDSSHPLKHTEIAQLLDREYGIALERKAIGKNINLLKEAGFDLVSTRRGSYLEERVFTDAEIRLLIDSVLSSKHIAANYAKELVEKLCTLTSEHFKSHVKYVHTAVSEWERTDRKELFWNMELIDQAIREHRQLHYDYNKYGVDKKLHKSSQQYVSPYQMILHNQRYYLMAYSEYWHNMVFHRLDRITNMSVENERATPITKVPGYENGINYKTLSTAMPYMYTDPQERIVFAANEAVTDQIIDWFGKGIRLEKHGENEVIVSLIASPRAMEHWAMQYANYVRVLAPEILVNKIKQNLKNAVKQYGK